jgi:hypothetical protein
MSVLEPEEQESLRRICRKLGRSGEELHERHRKKENRNDTSSTE